MIEHKLNETRIHTYTLLTGSMQPDPFDPDQVQFHCLISMGANTNTILTPSVTPHTDGSDAKLDVLITKDSLTLASIQKGYYNLQVRDQSFKSRVNDVVFFDFPSESSHPDLEPTYANAEDVEGVFATIGKFPSLGNEPSRFYRQLRGATNWLNSQIIAKAEMRNRRNNGSYGCYIYNCDYEPLINGTYVEYDISKITSLLNDWKLVTDDANDFGIAKGIVATMAASKVFANNPVVGDNVDYVELAERLSNQAINGLNGWVPKLDDNGTIIAIG